jgi:HlyD family secretion protein
VPNAALRFRPPADPSTADKGAPKGPPAGTGGGARRGDGSQRVHKLVDGKLVPVTVKTGISDASFTEVLGGELAEGDKLVTRDLAGQGGPSSQMRLRMF